MFKEVALKEFDAGYYIVPITQDKRPVEGFRFVWPEKTRLINGYNEAGKVLYILPHPRWFIEECLNLNSCVGFAYLCGQLNNIIAYDFDCGKNKKNRQEAFAALRLSKNTWHRAVRFALSASGGVHIYYKYDDPPFLPRRNFPGDGYDVQCRNKLIVAPPSFGGGYRWTTEKQLEELLDQHLTGM